MTKEEESKEYPRRVGGHEGRAPVPGVQAVVEASGGRKIQKKGLGVNRSSLDASPTTAAAPKPKPSAIGLSKANERRRKAKIINPNASDPSCRPVDAGSSNHGFSIPKTGMGLSKANRNRRTNQVDLNGIMDHCLDEEHGETQERHWVKDYCLDDERGEIEDTVTSLPNHGRGSESAAESVPRLVENMAADNVAIQENPAPSIVNDGGYSLGDSPPPPASDSSNEGLAVASPVSQHPQAQAEEVDEEEQQATARAKKQDAIRRTFLCVGGGLLTTVTILLLVLFVPREENALVPENETVAKTATLQENILQIVSNVSQEESFHNPDSAQSKALRWILEDPALSNYSDWRIQQRYILATFYYATGGPNWSLNGNWLNHSVHECQWHTYNHYFPPVFQAIWPILVTLLSGKALAIDDAPCGEPWETSGVFKYLFLMANRLTGTVPDEIFRLFSLRGINLSANSELQGTISTEIALLTDLQVLGFIENPRIQGAIPTQMGLLSHLTDFHVWNSPIVGTLPSELGMLSNSLQSVALVWDNKPWDHAGMEGTIPTQIGSLASLEVLLLIGGAVTGTVPITLERLKNLTLLDLEYNYMTGEIPSQIGLLTSLTSLFLGFNLLTGPVPSQVGLMASMTDMALVDNLLTGPIPSQIGLLTSTTSLRLHNNSLTGPIPSELGLLTDTIIQRLGNNLLTSTIPSELGLMKDTIWLFLSNNTLIGQVPSQLGLLTSCTMLWLHDNELSGAIPEALCAMGQGDPSTFVGLSFDCKENLCGCSWCPCANDTFGG